MVTIDRTGLDRLLRTLSEEGYELIGPREQDGSIVYEKITSTGDFPSGWTDVQAPASYALERRNDNALFGFVVSPHSWKRFLFPPRLKLFEAKKNGKEFSVIANTQDGFPKYAFIGVRSCELHALAIHDKVFVSGEVADPSYALLRKNVFIIAVNCLEPKGNCFCGSMNTGPKVTEGYDLALTELVDGKTSSFVMEAGSQRGTQVLEKIPHRPSTETERRDAEAGIERAAQHMGKVLDTQNLKEILYQNLEHPEWDAVAKRCLMCTNCTMVCPTCFCSTVEDITDLGGQHAERWRRWDSCFTLEFAKVAGGNFRSSGRSRYRQWMTHKLASWQDQFGPSGCVGCGRCITWCPVGIDITEEARKIRDQVSEVKSSNPN